MSQENAHDYSFLWYIYGMRYTIENYNNVRFLASNDINIPVKKQQYIHDS